MSKIHPHFPGTFRQCMRFWLHISGSSCENNITGMLLTYHIYAQSDTQASRKPITIDYCYTLAVLVQLIQWLIYSLVGGGCCLFLLLRNSKAKTEPHPGLSSSTSVCFTFRVKVLGFSILIFTSGWLVIVEVKCWVRSGVRLETC